MRVGEFHVDLEVIKFKIVVGLLSKVCAECVQVPHKLCFILLVYHQFLKMVMDRSERQRFSGRLGLLGEISRIILRVNKESLLF